MRKLFLAFSAAALFLGASVAKAAQKSWVTTSVQTGDTITNTTAETALASRLAVQVLSPNEVLAGQAFTIDCRGIISTAASSPGTLTANVTIAYGNSTSSLTNAHLGTTGAFTPAAGLSSAPWRLTGWGVFASNGPSGTAVAFTDFEINENNVWVPYSMRPSGMTTGTVGWATGVDRSQYLYNLLGASFQWGTASASNVIVGACNIDLKP